MHDFYPKEIYVESGVRDLPLTKRVLSHYPNIPVFEVTDKSEIKLPMEHTRAKRQLFIARYAGDPIKSCQGMGNYVCCQYFTIALVSDCHLECTYCILQDYLKNNPIITFYANTDEIFAKIRERVAKHPDRIFRIGTGELSDSLALDHITGFTNELVDFAAKTPNVILELKTKTNNIENLLGLDHQKRVVVGFSLNPQSYIDTDELKCASLEERLLAAKQVSDAGYPVGIHLDPLLNFPDWESKYEGLIQKISETLDAEKIAWISIGSLRFTKDLKKISQERFPKSSIMSGEMIPSEDGKMRYFRPLREEMYKKIKSLLEHHLKKAPHYLCMETKPVWQNVFGEIPKSNFELEQHLLKNLPQTPTACTSSFTV